MTAKKWTGEMFVVQGCNYNKDYVVLTRNGPYMAHWPRVRVTIEAVPKKKRRPK